MTDQQAQSQANSGRSSTIGLVLACYLIASFLWNIAIEAHEYALRTEQVLTISLNLLGVIGLFAIRLTSDSAWWTGHLFFSIPPR